MSKVEDPLEQVRKRISSNSPKMQEVISSINKVANTDIPVLLIGEKGTGKRHSAQTIHHLSSRQEGPYTIVDCDSQKWPRKIGQGYKWKSCSKQADVIRSKKGARQ